MARRIVAEFDAVTGPFLQKLNRIDQSIGRFEKGTLTSFNRVERGVNTLVGTASRLRTLTGLFATGFGVNLGTGFLDQAKLIRNALREAGDTSEETFNKVFQSSVRALAGFRDTAQGVQRFQKALGDRQGISQSIRQLETLNKLLALAGKTTQERSSTFIQFSQALQAGYLGGEELRAVRENAPIELTREIAKVAGGTIKDLKKLAEAGKLTTDVMVQALENLEEEADRRFGNIEVTIQDAAKVFASGALIATEGFDKGLGLSRATVTGLKNLGVALGENAEAFEMWGRVAQVAAGVLATSFAGRNISRLTGSFRELANARAADVSAAQRQVVATRAAYLAEQARLQTAVATTAALRSKGEATKALEKAVTKQNAAYVRVEAAAQRHKAAVNALSVANARLSLTTRAAATAMGLMRGAFAFIGGWPGLILTTAFAFHQLNKYIETSEEKLARINDAVGTWREGQREIQNIQKDINEIISSTGGKLDAQAQREVDELTKKYADQLDAQQRDTGQKLLDLNIIESDIREKEQLRDEVRRQIAEFQAIAEAQGLGTIAGQTAQQLIDINQGVLQKIESDLVALIEGRKALKEVVREGIAQDEDLDELSLQIDAKRLTAQYEGAAAAVRKFVQERRTENEKNREQLAFLEAQREVLIQNIKDESAVKKTLAGDTDDLTESDRKNAALVVQLDDAMRDMRHEMIAGGDAVRDLSDDLIELRDAMDKVAGVRLGIRDNIGTLQTQLAALRRGASEAEVGAIPGALDSSRDVLRAGGTPDQAAQVYQDILTDAKEENRLKSQLDDELKRLFGTGSKSGKSDLEKAADVIERMMTDQERMASAIREAEQLRKRLANGTQAEQAAVKQLDEAISRMKDEYEELNDVQSEFFDSMAQQLADAITDWTNFGDVVRQILASLVREYGPDFFKTIFTPGQQKNDDGNLGVSLGNLLTKLFHDGGRSGRRRSVSPLAFIGAPRFHKGLLPDEFPAILQKGEAVIPKNLAGRMGGAATFVFNNDFRNADPSMKPWIEAQLARQRAEFESRWVKTARKVNMSRLKV